MNYLKIFLPGILVWLTVCHVAVGQGCVAVRPMSCSSPGIAGGLITPNKNLWQISANYRYYKSHRHFRGDVEQKEREEEDTEVININNTVDIGILYGLTSRVSIALNVPVIWYDRSSLYEHYGNSPVTNPDHKRFSTSAQGIGDMRLTGYYYIFDPGQDSLRGNILAGLGVKFPTGDSEVMDEFHRLDSEGQDSTFERPVDQSIQLGDGGWGFVPEIQAYYLLSRKFSLYINAFYMFNPENVNNTLTRGVPPVNYVDSLTGWHSVADQYALRLGANFSVLPKHGLSVSLGARMEGVPSKDLIGDNEGFRRPGYIVSAEPGVSWMNSHWSVFASVPVALYRNRTKSYSDLERDKLDPSVDHHGDAAFADYLINVDLVYRFSGKRK